MNKISQLFLGRILAETKLDSDRIKIRLVFNLSLIYLFVLLIPIPIYISIITVPQLAVSLFGISGALATLFTLKYFRSYVKASIVYCVIGFLSNFLSIIAYGNGKLDLVMFPWFIAHALFAFLTIGKRFGLGMLVAALFAGFSIQFIHTLPIWNIIKGTIPQNPYDVVSSNFMVFLFIYLIIDKFIQIHNNATQQALTSFHIEKEYLELQKENEINIRSGKQKEQFLANMSHEVRTPMNSIIGLTNLLLKSPNFNEKETKFLNAISINSKSLLSLINDILDFSKIDAGKFELSTNTFILQEMFDDIEQSFLFLIQEKNLNFSIELDKNIPKVIIADQVRINQVFTNLISNAIKFTDNGSIFVKVNLKQQLEDILIVECSVKDTGVGISKENHKKIFETFYQVQNSEEKKQIGTGLGLSIVKNIIEKMDGNIHVESEVNKGTEFIFQLQLAY